eukprot:TCONS_00042075-protein
MAASSPDVFEDWKTIFNEKISDTEELIACVKEILPFQSSENTYEIISVKGTTNAFKTTIGCSLKNDGDVKNFIEEYCKKTDETIRARTAKVLGNKSKSQYHKIHYFRCHHRTHHPPTMNHIQVLKADPSKRFRNADCPFSMSIRIFRDESAKYPAQINIEYSHSHSTKSLQSLSFKDIPDHVSKTIHELFQKGYTPGLAYREMMQDLKSKSIDDLDFHLKLADSSQMPRRRDFNSLYTDYHRRLFGTAN